MECGSKQDSRCAVVLYSSISSSSLLLYFFCVFVFLSFSVNPIIYAYSSREFRRAFIKYLCRCFPIRVRNVMMSYHNLHVLRYRRPPESNVSKENNESGSDRLSQQKISNQILIIQINNMYFQQVQQLF